MATKGIGAKITKLQPAVLELEKISAPDLQAELAKSRIMEAVHRHIREDLDVNFADIDFSLRFGLSL